MTQKCLSPLPCIWFLGFRPRSFNNPFSGCHGGEGWNIWEMGSHGRNSTQITLNLTEKLGGNQLSCLPCESESISSSDGTRRVKWMWNGLRNGSLECPGEAEAGPPQGRGLDYLVLWSESHCVQRESEKVLSIFIFFEAEYEGCTCRKWRRGEVRRKSPWLWLKYGNWWSRESLEPLPNLGFRSQGFSFWLV